MFRIHEISIDSVGIAAPVNALREERSCPEILLSNAIPELLHYGRARLYVQWALDSIVWLNWVPFHVRVMTPA